MSILDAYLLVQDGYPYLPCSWCQCNLLGAFALNPAVTIFLAATSNEIHLHVDHVYCYTYFTLLDSQLTGVIGDLYGAGTETTSSTLQW